MNKKEPPKRQFPETAPHVSKRKINKKCGDTGKGYPPFQALEIVKNMDVQCMHSTNLALIFNCCFNYF